MKTICKCLCLLLLLTGCGKEAFDPAAVAAHYAACVPNGEYTVTTHDSFFTEYRLSSQTREDQTTVTILEPSSVAGVKALLLPDQVTLQYEDAAVDFLLPEIAGFTPMDALAGITRDLKGSVPAAFCLQGDTIILDFQEVLPDGTETLKQVALQADTLELLSAELYLNGDLTLALQMKPAE